MLQVAENLIVDGVFRRVDPRFQGIVGESVAQLEGREVAWYVHPESQAEAERRIRTIGAGGMVFPTRFKIVDCAGHTLDVLLSSKLLTVDDRLASISRCRVLTGPYCDLDTIEALLAEARALHVLGHYGPATRLLREATRLLSPDAPPEIASLTLLQMSACLERAGYRDTGRLIRGAVGELSTELGISFRFLAALDGPRAGALSVDAPPSRSARLPRPSGRILPFRSRRRDPSRT